MAILMMAVVAMAAEVMSHLVNLMEEMELLALTLSFQKIMLRICFSAYTEI